MRQNRCTHLQNAPATARLRALRPAVTQSLTNRHTEQQVRGVFDTEQRLKRLKLAIYDAHALTRTPTNVSIYLELESLQSLFPRQNPLTCGFPPQNEATQHSFSR